MGGLKVFGLLILTFVVTLTLLDYSRNMGMKQAVYEALRLANQSSLLEMNASYEQN